MAIEKMMLLNMTFDRSELDKVLFHLNGSHYFYPQAASKIVNNVKGVQTLQEDNEYTKLMDELIQIASDIQLDLNKDLPNDQQIDYQKVTQYLKDINNEVKKIKEVQDQLILERNENEKTLDMVNHLSLSEVNLDHITGCHYVTVRFGRLRRENVDRLKYYEGKPFIFNKLGEDRQYTWCCYIVTHNLQLEIDNIFQALGFEEIVIPQFVHGTLDEGKKELENEIQAMNEYILRMDQKTTILRETHKVDLLKLYSTVSFLQRMESYKVFVVDYQSKCAVYGFIPVSKVEGFKERFQTISTMEYKELPLDTLDVQGVESPTVVHNAKFVKPFEMISKVKQAEKIDTTLAFAFLYYTVFIIFLGDLGIGALLLLLGVFTRKKKIGKLSIALGIAAVIGGLVYGDVFYTISLYPAIALPLTTLFKLIDGLALLVVGTFTINSFKKMYNQSTTIDKVLSIKGICGLMCVYAIVVYLGCVYEAHMSIPFMPFAIIIVACLVLVIMKKFIRNKITK